MIYKLHNCMQYECAWISIIQKTNVMYVWVVSVGSSARPLLLSGKKRQPESGKWMRTLWVKKTSRIAAEEIWERQLVLLWVEWFDGSLQGSLLLPWVAKLGQGRWDGDMSYFPFLRWCMLGRANSIQRITCRGSQMRSILRSSCSASGRYG